MATAASVTAKIQKLIETANATTGNADTDLTTAIGSLIAGYGTGGSGGLPTGISAIEVGEYTPVSDQTGPISIPHGLGVAPNLVFLTVAGDITSLSNYKGYSLSYVGFAQNVTSSTQIGIYLSRQIIASGGASTSSAVITAQSDLATETAIAISGNRVLKGGQPYRWVAAVVDGI